MAAPGDLPKWDVYPIPSRRWITTKYNTPATQTISATFAVIGRTSISLIDIPFDCIIDRLCYQVGAAAAGNARIGLYREGGTIDLPDGGTLVAESGSVAQPGTHRTVVNTLVPVEPMLTRGRYYVALQGDNITGTAWFMFDSASNFGRYYDHAYGAFGNPCPVTVVSDRSPVVGLRIKKVLA